MKTLDELLEDRDAIAAVQTLVAHGYGPDVVREAVDRFAAHGMRRGTLRAHEFGGLCWCASTHEYTSDQAQPS